jgi:putative polyhydroxyalkanoate system protein
VKVSSPLSSRPASPLVAHIDVTHPHHLGPAGARRAAERVLEDLRREHGLSLEAHWEGDTLVASGRGFHARLHAGPEDVRVTAELGFLLRALRGRIRHEVYRYLHHYLADGAEADPQ